MYKKVCRNNSVDIFLMSFRDIYWSKHANQLALASLIIPLCSIRGNKLCSVPVSICAHWEAG